jgi:hypothetical protein
VSEEILRMADREGLLGILRPGIISRPLLLTALRQSGGCSTCRAVHSIRSSTLAWLLELDRDEEARAETAEVLRFNPRFSPRSIFKDPALNERYIADLRKAGLK